MPSRTTRWIAATALLAAMFGGCVSEVRQERARDHYIEGQLLMEQGKLEEALAELARAIDFDASLAVAFSAMGDIARQKGDYQAAAGSYRKAIDADPYAFRPHYNLGVTYEKLAEAARAVADATRYIRQAVEVYLRAAELEPTDFDTNINLSACYYRLDKYPLAEKYCRAAIEANPERPEAYSNLGLILDAQGRYAEAIAAYKQSLELKTHQPKLLLNMGSTHLKMGRIDLACRTFEMAAEQAPDDPAPWEQIGSCRYRQQAYDKAAEAFAQAVEIDAASYRAHRGLGVVYMSQYLETPDRPALRDQALEAWRQSLAIEPDQPELARLVAKYAQAASGD